MNGKKVILAIIIASISFNIIFITSQISAGSEIRWLFPELGPAVIQDSGLGRSPALESPFGIIGDIPGCYSLYDGNPLQHVDVGSPKQSSDMEIVILAIVFAIIPLTGVLILGRRSYGATKTQ